MHNRNFILKTLKYITNQERSYLRISVFNNFTKDTSWGCLSFTQFQIKKNHRHLCGDEYKFEYDRNKFDSNLISKKTPE